VLTNFSTHKESGLAKRKGLALRNDSVLTNFFALLRVPTVIEITLKDYENNMLFHLLLSPFSRIAMFLFIPCMLVTATAYSGGLVSVLTVDVFPPPPDTMDEVSNILLVLMDVSESIYNICLLVF